MMCADGFLPRIVEDESPYISVDWNGNEDIGIPVRYFTCCPPYDPSSSTAKPATNNVTRQCSDPITDLLETDDYYDESDSTLCGYASTRKHPRQMKPSVAMKQGGLWGPIKTKVDSFLCCASIPTIGDDSESENNTIAITTDSNSTIGNDGVFYIDSEDSTTTIVTDSNSTNGDDGVINIDSKNDTATTITADSNSSIGNDNVINNDSENNAAANSNATIGDDSDIYSDHENDITIIKTDFLDDLECVPYRNEFYDAAIVKNDIGTLNIISCDVPEGDFWFPRPVGEESTIRQYQCCKNGPAIAPFVQDSAFKITLYPVVALNCVAAVASAIVAIGLLVPLLIELKSGFRRSTPSSNHTQSKITSNHSPSNITPGSASTHQRAMSQIGEETPHYNTFDLYLVYLALFDFIHSLCFVVWFGSYINQKFDPGFYHDSVFKTYAEDKLFHPDTLITYPYIVANVWINAIIFYQLLVLLHSSQLTRRIKLPSLRRVNLQTGVVCLISVTLGSILYFLLNASENVRALSIIFVVFVALVLFLPIVYVLNVTIVIWWRGYIPSANGASPIDKDMRELSLYFFRIVGVFMGIWIPLGLVQAIAIESEEGWAFVIPWWFIAIQPILRTCMVLTKPNARKYILDLVTLSYLFGICTRRNEKKGAQDKTKTPLPRDVSRDCLASSTADAYVSDNDANADADRSSYNGSAHGAGVADSGVSGNNAADDPETGIAPIYPPRRSQVRRSAVSRSVELRNNDADGDINGHSTADPETRAALRRIRLRPIATVLRSGEIVSNDADGDANGHAAADPERGRTSIYPSRRSRVLPIADLRPVQVLETTTKDNPIRQ
jgi:hypothetical protein